MSQATPDLIGSLPSTTVTLASLPTEIKSQIVNFAKLQDESYKARAESPNLHKSALVKEVLKENRWRGKSLNALFLVNMEWSELAAIHLFSALEIYDIDSFTTEQLIVPRRALVRSVTFNNSNLERKTLLFLGLLPNLSKMIVAGSSVEEFFGDLSKLGSTGNFEQDQLYRTFLLASKSITSVTLESFTAAEATAILSAFPNVKELEFTTAVMRGSGEEEVEGLGNSLSKLSLKKLVFARLEVFIPTSWITQDWVSPLTFLRLRSRVMTISHLNFLNKFSSTLEVLNFEVSLESVLPDFTSTVLFRKLTRLGITTHASQFSAVLDLFSASPLVSLTIECHDIDITQEAITINNSTSKFIRKSSSLRYLELRLRFIDINQFSTLSTLCDSKGIVLELSVWNDQIIEDVPMDVDMKLIYYKPALEKVLNYGQRKLIELEKEENIEGMEEMFENCKWLRANAAEMMD